jgi:hypothetical protein
MSNVRRKLINCLSAIFGMVSIVPNLALAQSGTTKILRGSSEATEPPAAIILRGSSAAQPQTTGTQGDMPNRVTVIYVPPTNPKLQKLYSLLRERRALEKIQEILSPFRLPEELTIKTKECGVVNAWYGRREGTVTLCYDLLKHILKSLPKKTSPAGVTPADAAVGQFVFVTLHEVGHATFDIFSVPIFGHLEDAADNFATYIMLHFDKEQARRLIGGAAWAWRADLVDYKKNPVVQTRMARFAFDHGLPQERLYNLVCLAYGADPENFPEVKTILPPTRIPQCKFEYVRVQYAFRKEIAPHIDKEMASRVLDTNWLSNEQLDPAKK